MPPKLIEKGQLSEKLSIFKIYLTQDVASWTVNFEKSRISINEKVGRPLIASMLPETML